ncbi:Crp/Fnr family transcriptional regulator [Granulosicoccus sp. 3-233]
MSEQSLPEPFNAIDANGKHTRELTAGQSLFIRGDPTTGLFYLQSGAIDLNRQTVSGHNIILHRVRAGETFAEAALFSDFYHCTAVATEDSVVVECLRGAIDMCLSGDSDFARQLARHFAFQVQSSRRHVELLSIRSAEDRILLAMEDGLLGEDVSAFAELIGLAQETVYRTLKRLTDNRRIEKTARGRYNLLS